MDRSMRTDLALEIKESFEEDNVEIKGVILDKEELEEGILLTTVKIETTEGARAMRKPIGTYVTIEDVKLSEDEDSHRDAIVSVIAEQVRQLCQGMNGKQTMVVGLGNREVTLDSLGPRVIDELFMTRHLIRELGKDFAKRNQLESVSGLAPGVMAQTGMETSEIIQGVCRETEPDLVIVIDALAAGSKHRLASTIQITDTGICPGSGVGNNRKVLNEETLGAKVVALGVPMVMDMEADSRFFITPRNIDEAVVSIAETVAEALNQCFCGSQAKSQA